MDPRPDPTRVDATVGGAPPPQLLQSAAAQQRTFGRFTVVRELGRGGMGLVVQAWDPRLARHVAIKVVDPNLAGPNALARFQREAQAMARLDHPGLVPVLETGEEHGRPYLVMELVEGESLEALLRRERLPRRRAVELVRDLAAALAEAHRHGVLHRDIKPSNILMDRSGRPRITDFGLARLGVASLTRTGDVLGTPSYMAPEQAGESAGTHGPASDVYSLGVVLYRALTGRLPLEAGNVTEYLTKLVREQPPAPRALDPTIEPELEAIVLRCLQKEPARRYPDAGAVHAALEERLRAPPPAPSSPAPRRAWLPAATFALGALLAGGGAFVLRPAPAEPAAVTTPPPDTAPPPVATTTPPTAPTPRLPPLYASLGDGDPRLVAVWGEPGLRHAEGIKAVAVSPDGARVVTSAAWYQRDRPVTLYAWDVMPDGLRPRWARLTDGGMVRAIAFVGDLVVTGALDGTLRAWDRDTGEERGDARRGAGVWSMDVTPDGRRVVVARSDALEVLDATGAVTASAPVVGARAVAVVDDRRAFLVREVDGAGVAELIGLDAPHVVEPIAGDPGVGVARLRVDAPFERALSVGNGQFREWDLRARRLLYAEQFGLNITAADFLRGTRAGLVILDWQGALLHRGGFDESIRARYDERAGFPSFAVGSLGGDRVVIGNEQAELRVHDLRSGADVQRTPASPAAVARDGLARLPDGRVVVTREGTYDRSCTDLVDAATGAVVDTLRAGLAAPVATLVGAGHVVVAETNYDRPQVAMWTAGARGFAPVRRGSSPFEPLTFVTAAAMREDGTFFTGDLAGTILEWHVDGRDPRLLMPGSGFATIALAAPVGAEGVLVASARFPPAVDGVAQPPDAGTLLRATGVGAADSTPLTGRGPSALCPLRADRVLVGCSDGALLTWDPTRRSVEELPARHGALVQRIATSGDRAASCGNDGLVLVWSVRSGAELRRVDLGRAGDYARAVLFLDARTILVGTQRGVVLRLELPE